MSDDLERDDDPRRERIRPTREDRPLPEQAPDRDRPRRRFEDNEPVRPSGGSGVKVVLIILAVVALVGLCLIGGVVGGLWYSVGKIRVAAERTKSSNNLKQIGIAIHMYHDIHRELPPPSMKTRNGKPGLSWRVALLPQMEHESLYRQFKLDEPWDHPDNLRLASKMPSFYRSPDSTASDRTHYRVFIGRGAAFDPGRERLDFAGIKDGLASTIFVVEAQQSVLWIQPDELPFDRNGTVPPLGLPDTDDFIALYGDGAVRRHKKSFNAEKLKLAIIIDDGQLLDLDN